MATQQERNEMITKIQSLSAELEVAIQGLNDAQLDTPYRDGGWTVRQVVHHLADSHINAFVRMKLILTENNPPLKAYNQDAWAVTADAKLPLASSLTILRGLHERWTVLLQAVQEHEWIKTAIHPERGAVTLESQLVIYSNHGKKHIGHIMGLRNTKGW